MFPFSKIPGRTWLLPVLLCGLFLIGVPAVRAGTAPVDPVNDPAIWSLTDTWSVTLITGLDISPAGRDIAYVVKRPYMDSTTSEFRTAIYYVQDDGSGTKQLTSDAQSCSSPAWSPEGRRLAYLSLESGTPQVWIMNADGSEQYRLTDHGTGVASFSWSPDGKQISYIAPIPLSAEQKRAAEAKEDPIVASDITPGMGLYLVRVVPAGQGFPQARLLTPTDISPQAQDWLPDSSGLIFIHNPSADIKLGVNASISRLDTATGKITPLVPAAKNHSVYGKVLVSPDGRDVAYSTERLFNIMDISIVPVDGGTSRKIITDLDQGAVLLFGITGWSSDGKILYVPEAKGTTVTMNAIPVDGSAPQELFRYGNILPVKENSWRTVFAYTAEDSGIPSEIYITPIAKFEPFQVTRLNEGLPIQKFGKTEVVRWNSTDGKVIEGLLTYPVNYTAGARYALIIEPHGGPSGNFARYFIGGPIWPILPAGTFSSLGYAVLRPNIRGSTGYGVDFAKANLADWGGGDYRDLIAGADYLVAKGVADPNRMGIIGQSYGGYMSAWTVTQTDKFKGAVVIDGITDLVSNVGTNDIPFDEPDNFGGEFWDKWDLYASRSPIRHVENISTPTLVVSGQNDVRVPLGQSQEFYTALWKRGVPSDFVIYPRAGHFPGEPKEVQDLWLREIGWMDSHVRGGS
ncbi:MAG: S9 family peptidase [Methanoregula sp.]|nr:S9 family peptidase [Methanoregula sp.]